MPEELKEFANAKGRRVKSVVKKINARGVVMQRVIALNET